MAAKQRDHVERFDSSESRMTFAELMKRFPNNDACLEYLKERFYPAGTACPSCHKASKFHRIKGRSAYSCQYCGHHVYPTAGTIFHKHFRSFQCMASSGSRVAADRTSDGRTSCSGVHRMLGSFT